MNIKEQLPGQRVTQEVWVAASHSAFVELMRARLLNGPFCPEELGFKAVRVRTYRMKTDSQSYHFKLNGEIHSAALTNGHLLAMEKRHA